MRLSVLSPVVASLALGALSLAGCGGGDPAARSAIPEPEPEYGLDPAEFGSRAPLVGRLLVVALDGATWDLLDPVIEAGRAPNLARLVEEGVRAELITLEPTVSPAIWTTIATGFLPDQHGILGFEGVPGATMTTLPNARMRLRKTYWNALSDFGVTSGTVGWWASWPADPLSGGSFLISDRVPYTRMEASVGRTSLDAGDARPEELLDVVAPLIERPNELAPEVAREWLGMGEAELQTYLLDAEYRMGRFLPEFKFVYQSDRSTRNVAVRAFEEMPVQVWSVYFTGIDTVSHLFWHFAFPGGFPAEGVPAASVTRFGDVIFRYYEQVDAWLGDLLAAAGEGTTVLVVSDHGFGGTGRLPWSGGHGRLTPGAPIAPRGILVLSGPGARPGPAALDQAHVLDVAPTILHLMGVPASREMIGRVLTGALDPDLPEELPRVDSLEEIGLIRRPTPPPLDPPGDAERLERLRALGYIQ